MAKKLGLKVKKEDFMALGLGIAGGVAANQATNFIERQSFMQGKEKFAPLITLAVGVLGFLFAPEKIRPLFSGMAIVSGTEEVESLLAKAMGPTAPLQGFSYKQLGFQPQVRPEWQNPSIIRNAQTGVVIR